MTRRSALPGGIELSLAPFGEDRRWISDRDVAEARTWDGHPAIRLGAPKKKSAIEWHGRRVQDGAVLRRFIQLSRGDTAAIALFVRRYGPLEMCEAHGYWIGHGVEAHGWLFGDDDAEVGTRCSFTSSIQPITAYQGWARLARETLEVSHALRLFYDQQARSPRVLTETEKRRLWANILKARVQLAAALQFLTEFFAATRGGVDSSRPAAEAWSLVQESLDLWLEAGRVRPVVKWNPNQLPTIVMAGRGLWGALTRQLVRQVAASEGLDFCHACGAPFTPGSRREKYCASCRDDGAPQRLASRNYRKRERRRP
jgi:hypothetical protein